MKHLIADLTRANPGSEARLLAPYLSADDLSGLWLVHYERQTEIADKLSPNAKKLVLRNNAHYTEVVAKVVATIDARIDEATGATPMAAELLVLSFHSSVLALSKRYFDKSTLPVRILSWTDAYQQSARESEWGEFWWPENFMSPEEACSVLENALRQHARVRMSELRFILAAEDGRFDKGDSVASATPGLLKQLVSLAQKKNLIRVEMTRPGDVNPVLHTVKPMVRTEAPSAKSNGAKKSDVRSRDMERILRGKNLGPFSRIRGALFDKLEDAARQNESLERTISTCVEATRLEQNSTGYPWRVVQQFVITLMQRRPIALSNSGEPITPTLLGRAEVVGGLREGWRLEWEGELIVALLEDMQDLHPAFDMVNLALMLHHTGEPATIVQVHEVLAHLARQKRIYEDTEAGGFLRLASKAEETEAPPTPESSSGDTRFN